HGWRHMDTSTLWKAPGTLQSTLLDAFGQLPEVILFWEGYHLLNTNEKSINALRCKKYIFIDDLHWRNLPMRVRKRRAFFMFDTILFTYGYAFYKFYPDVYRTNNIVWVPHSASPDFMRPYNECAENAIFLSGAINENYPLRQR